MDTQDIEGLKKQNTELLLALRYFYDAGRHGKGVDPLAFQMAASAIATAAQSAPASAPEVGYLVVGTLVEEGVVTVYVHLKEGDSTIVLYLKNHALNGETIGIMPLPVGVVDRIRTPAVGAVGQKGGAA